MLLLLLLAPPTSYKYINAGGTARESRFDQCR